jgi:DedD protein
MRTLFEEEEELTPNGPRHNRGEDHGQDYDPDQGPDRELTISSTTLLAIFFGLVLVCGLFFGFGYTLGRRSNSEAGQLPSVAAPLSDSQPAVSTSKPSAASQPASTATLPAADPEGADVSASPAADAEPQDDSSPAKSPETPASPAPQIVKPALPLVAQSPAPQAAPATAPAGASPGIMVQIAAISNPADAEVLVGALQKHGYSVTARRAPGDALIHVQAGPFSNRADAIAVRQKLLGDGYNAILK